MAGYPSLQFLSVDFREVSDVTSLLRDEGGPYQRASKGERCQWLPKATTASLTTTVHWIHPCFKEVTETGNAL